MPRPLPPLNALRAFDATARHLSFSKAAEELHVTPAALSHQIRGLEENLGLKLFHRRARAIELTEAGRLLHPGLRSGFDSIREAVSRLDGGNLDRILVVSATPGLTAKWLVPRLYRFLSANPDIDARISATMGYADFSSDGVDVAIRMSPGNHPDLFVEKLTDEWVVPLCSPKLLEGPQAIRTPADLARATLIHYELPLVGAVPRWSDWFESAGLPDADAARGLRFNVADHALEAALGGAGVALAYKLMALGDAQSGRLVKPFGPELPVRQRAYYLVCPKGHEKRPKIRAFREWLLSEIPRNHGAPLPEAAAGR